MDNIRYLAIFLGSLLEGEMPLIAGSYLVHRGYFEMPKVMIVCLVAALIIDWIYFVIGRKHGRKFLHNRPKLQSKLNSVTGWIETYPVLLMLFYRFLYGIRIPLAIAFGLSSYSAIRYGILSFIGTSLWVACYAAVGYYFGAFIEANFSTIRHYEFLIMGLLIILSLIIFYRVRKRNVKQPDDPTLTDQ